MTKGGLRHCMTLGSGIQRAGAKGRLSLAFNRYRYRDRHPVKKVFYGWDVGGHPVKDIHMSWLLASTGICIPRPMGHESCKYGVRGTLRLPVMSDSV